MVETLHPDVFTIERAGQPTIVGISTSTVGFVGTAKRGPTDELGFVSTFREFTRIFGEGFPDTFLEDAVFLFFQNGGARAFISRITGAGALKATATVPAIQGAPSAAVIDGTGTTPFNLEPGDTIEISVDGGGAQIFTFSATRAILVAPGPAVPTPALNDTLVVNFDGTGLQIVTFAGTESTADLICAAINAQVTDGRCVNIAGTLQLESDTRGTGSSAAVDVSSSAAGLTATGFIVAAAAGTGNVVNIDIVTIAEVLTITAGLTGATTSNNNGAVRITHGTTGPASTIEVTAAAAVFVFPAGSVAGSALAPVPMLQVDGINVGSWGDEITVSTERWRAKLTSALLAGSITSLVVDNVSRVELGDIVVIDDTITRLIGHVVAVDVATKTLTISPVTIGAGIASGTLVKSASSHRTRTQINAVPATGDLIIEVQNASQIRVGTELSIDDGTTLVFRKVTRVNGLLITLDAAIGTAYAIGTLVAAQHFDLTVSVEGVVETTHRFLSTQEEDEADFVENQLFGDSNRSQNIEVQDLAPAIATPINDHILPVISVQLSGGNDGVTPIDNDFLGAVDPPTGLELFNTLNQGDVNIIAIPGITTLAVQQGLSDFAERTNTALGQKVIALIDPPLTLDTALEVRDWRLNQYNRDTSFSALYFPWLNIRDRLSLVDGAIKQAPPSGPMAGIYARVDAEVGVWEAPANRPMFGVQSTVSEITDGQWDLLNPVGINLIRAFPGEGVRPMGARTLSNTFDGRHYVNIRRLLNFDKVSIAIALRRFLFAGIQSSLFGVIEDAIRSFHKNLWEQGALFPNDNFEKAQFVKVDQENNPLSSRKLGQLFVDAGINPPFPAEFIIFRIGLFDGETSVDEIVGTA